MFATRSLAGRKHGSGLVCRPQGASAQSADDSGERLCGGSVLSGRMAPRFAQVCHITQAGWQIGGSASAPTAADQADRLALSPASGGYGRALPDVPASPGGGQPSSWRARK